MMEHTSSSSSSGRAAPPRPPKGLLSLRDYTVIHAALEIMVHWGLVPVLEPGVGVFDLDKRPRSRAVKISRRVLHYWATEGKQHPTRIDGSSAPSRDSSSTTVPAVDAPSSAAAAAVAAAGTRPAGGGGGVPGAGGSGVGGVGEQAARAQLALCTGVIQGVVMTGQFMPMLMPLYLPDLLAARLQLVYGHAAVSAATAAAAAASATAAAPAPTTISPAQPRARGGDALKTETTADHRSPTSSPENRGPSPLSSDTPAASGTTSTGNGSVSSTLMMSSLRAVLKDVGPRHVMGALRHLLSQGARAPPWLRQRAGRILSEIVLRPGGVQATLEVYLAGAGAAAGSAAAGGEGDGEGDEIKACLRVAKLLATPPKRVGSGDYVARVVPQLAEMLHFDGQQRAIVTR